MGAIGKEFLVAGMDAQNAMTRAKLAQLEGRVNQVKALQKSSDVKELKGKEVDPAQAQQIDEAATQFEALLLQQMFKAMWSTVPQGGLLSGSQEEQHYRQMLNQALADEYASGQGIGIKDVIKRELSKYPQS